MKEITQEQCDAEMQDGTGYCGFMGGFSSKNGKEILEVDGKLYFFESRNDPLYEVMFKKQCEEGKKFIEEYTRVHREH